MYRCNNLFTLYGYQSKHNINDKIRENSNERNNHRYLLAKLTTGTYYF